MKDLGETPTPALEPKLRPLLTAYASWIEDREATWVWTELSRAVDGCQTGTILYDATYAIPSQSFTQHALVSVVYTRKHGRWLSVIDQSTLLPNS